jgi:phenylalanyl-tRNA synthetase beta chain
MRVSLEWLRDYIDIEGLEPQVLAEALTQSGLEVEEIESIGPCFSKVVVGKIDAIEPHPQADRLRLVSVDLGSHGKTRVVCGAPNVKEGIRIAFAMEGATVLNRKENKPFVLGRANIRGVESAGMVCSLEELSLETQFNKAEDGIWPLDSVPELANAKLGEDLRSALGLESDTVLHAAIPANRGDLMSLQGVAREVAALFNRKLTLKEPPVAVETATVSSKALTVKLEDSSVCPYYSVAVLENVKIAPSPRWMARRLEAAGMRSINTVVDITNYVMLETGQPLHAFDAQKLGLSGQIGVRRSQASEKLQTLDDVERTLTEDSILITHNSKPEALAGVMGGLETAVDDSTTQLALEAAAFPSAIIRRSGKSVGLRSEAAARFERGIDITRVSTAQARAIQLLQELAGAKLLYVSKSEPPAHQDIVLTLDLKRQEALLGLYIDAATTTQILQSLGCVVKPLDAGSLQVQVPSYRQGDLTRPVDLMEEVARIYGYEKIPYTLPRSTGRAPQSLRSQFLCRVHSTLSGQGLHEVMTPSLLGARLLEKTGFDSITSDPITVLNSHSIEHTQLRQTLLPGLLEVALHNQANRGDAPVWIYELGRSYVKRGKSGARHTGAQERLKLSVLLLGSPQTSFWKGTDKVDFYLLKGILENLLAELNLTTDAEFKASADWSEFHPGKTAELFLKGNKNSVGILGQLHPARQESLKLRQPVFLLELDAEALFKAGSPKMQSHRYEALTQFPAIQRDMAFLASQELTHQHILKTLESMNEPLLREVALFDEYRSEQLGADKKSLAYRLTFRDDSGTLKDNDVDQRFTTIKKSLEEKLLVQFR